MRIFAFAALLFTGSVTAFLSEEDFKTLAETPLDIPYNQNLSCGACVRRGDTYCMSRKSTKASFRDPGDICCDTEECVLKAMGKGGDFDCATSNPTFNDTDYFYTDRFVMLQKFCSKRQNKTACGCPNPKGESECKVKL